MLHYNPQHVSSSTLHILRRTDCIITASDTVNLCKRLYSMPVESGLSVNTFRLIYGIQLVHLLVYSYIYIYIKIKSRIVMAKAAFSKKKTLFTSKLDLNLRKKLIKCYI